MNGKFLNILRNISYTVVSNLFSLLVSIILVLIVPKILGVEDYGYFQLYLFYVTYVGFMHFGWNDGIYLRYGGKDYNNLDKKLFFSQFYMLAALQVVIMLTIILLSNIFVMGSNRIFVINLTAICMVIVNLRYMLMFILQSTNRIREYARITLLEKFIFCILIILLFTFNFNDFRPFIVADLLGKLFSFILAVYYCRDIVLQRVTNFYLSFKETIENITVGIKLMFSNIANNLIIGCVRFGIERTWSIAIFGKVSLTLSISSFMMLFINAISIVLFPLLRRIEAKKLPEIYKSIRDLVMIMLLGVLILYYPIKSILVIWLPEYEDSLIYMALLFPMCLYSGKMSLLINTFLNTLRKETLVLVVNIISLLLSVVLTFTFTLVIKNLTLTILNIVILLAFKSILAEIILSKILNISVYKDIILELFMTVIFILISWFINSWIITIIYGGIYLLYLMIKKSDLKSTFNNVKQLIRS